MNQKSENLRLDFNQLEELFTKPNQKFGASSDTAKVDVRQMMVKSPSTSDSNPPVNKLILLIFILNLKH